MKCEKCGSEMKLQEGIVYTSNPVQYGYKCPNCGNVQYSMIKEENNQMDYEKKYKNALEWARQVMNGEIGFIRKEVEEIFPELAESEDEQIRKNIISFLRSKNGYMNPDEDWDFHNKWLPWLEKQSSKEENLKERNICDTCEDSNGCLIPCCAKLLEKQGELPISKENPIKPAWSLDI